MDETTIAKQIDAREKEIAALRRAWKHGAAAKEAAAEAERCAFKIEPISKIIQAPEIMALRRRLIADLEQAIAASDAPRAAAAIDRLRAAGMRVDVVPVEEAEGAAGA